MSNDTNIGGRKDSFPATQVSAVAAVRSDDPIARARAFEVLVASYWKPVYKSIRIKWRKQNEEAKDLTQGFFAKAFEKEFFASYDPAKARFRTFLRMCLDRYVANQEKAGRRIKRGGDTIVLSLDFEEAEAELAQSGVKTEESADDQFDREWAKSLFASGVASLKEELRGRGKHVYFTIFERYDLVDDPAIRPTYAELAGKLGLQATDVTNYLAFARREFRRIVLERLRQITATDDEFRSEARAVLGVEAG